MRSDVYYRTLRRIPENLEENGKLVAPARAINKDTWMHRWWAIRCAPCLKKTAGFLVENVSDVKRTQISRHAGAWRGPSLTDLECKKRRIYGKGGRTLRRIL